MRRLTGGQGSIYTVESIPGLLMSWRPKEPGHQQPWYWLSYGRLFRKSWIVVLCCLCCSAAARCNKGLKVLYCAAVEHFVQVAVQVCRGTQKADTSLGHIRKVLHCQMCEEWALLPDSKAPVGRWQMMTWCCSYGPLTSWQGNAFSITGPLWGKSSNHRWIPLTKAQ